MKTCKKSISFQSKYVSFFLLGQTVQGIAGMPLYILGMSFIHENVATHSAGIYLGKFFFLSNMIYPFSVFIEILYFLVCVSKLIHKV